MIFHVQVKHDDGSLIYEQTISSNDPYWHPLPTAPGQIVVDESSGYRLYGFMLKPEFGSKKEKADD